MEIIYLKIAYNEDSKELAMKLNSEISHYPTVKLECYHEIKNRSKAYKLKGGYGSRISPFAVLIDQDKKVLRAFYSEDNSCTYSNIISTLNKYVPYN